jgi:hypothetical protein
MELRIYDTSLTLLGIIEKITSFIWTRRYWACGEFKLLVPYTERHIELLKMYRIIMKRGDNEAAQIKYIHIRRNTQGFEEIEVTGRFLTGWIGKRIVRNQIIALSPMPQIIQRIVRENVTHPTNVNRRINNIALEPTTGVTRPTINYATEEYSNALLACEAAAKASFLGFGIFTDARAKTHHFRIYDGLNLTADQQENPPCVFSQEFDNVLEQEYTNSVENLRTTAYVGGEDKEGVTRQIVEVNPQPSGLERDEMFVNATDITQSVRDESGNETLIPLSQYIELLRQRGVTELEYHAETLSFSSKVNTHSNLKYKIDYNLGDRVTCVNRKWGVRINVRITEISEIYQRDTNEINITFGESIPALMDAVRHMIT